MVRQYVWLQLSLSLGVLMLSKKVGEEGGGTTGVGICKKQ